VRPSRRELTTSGDGARPSREIQQIDARNQVHGNRVAKNQVCKLRK
jgi:hypothetical protein